MTMLNVALSDDMRAYVELKMAQEGHATASEYFQSLILAEQKRTARRLLQGKLREALASGPAEPMTHDDWVALRREALDGLAGETIRP